MGGRCSATRRSAARSTSGRWAASYSRCWLASRPSRCSWRSRSILPAAACEHTFKCACGSAFVDSTGAHCRQPASTSPFSGLQHASTRFLQRPRWPRMPRHSSGSCWYLSHHSGWVSSVRPLYVLELKQSASALPAETSSATVHGSCTFAHLWHVGLVTVATGCLLQEQGIADCRT
jgi:hypothetical protein